MDGVYGIITAPNHGGVVAGVKAGLPWAADLGCIDGPSYVKRINMNMVIEWLGKMSQYHDTCLFIAGADVVGDAESTLEAYEEFGTYFSGWPVAYIAQNGAENLPIPENCAAVFIGGDTTWKESGAAVSVIKRAQMMGKHIHVGRVNWARRYNLFNILEGSESFTCDGTRTKYDGTKKTIEAWRGYESQPPLITI